MESTLARDEEGVGGEVSNNSEPNGEQHPLNQLDTAPGFDPEEFLFTDLDRRPSTRLAYFAMDKVAELGPDADRTALGLLQSTNESLRALGIAMLARIPELDGLMLSKAMALTATEEHFALAGWLNDLGRSAFVPMIAAALEASPDEVQLMLEDGVLEDPAARAALDWLATNAGSDTAKAMARKVALDDRLEPATRLHALFLAGQGLPEAQNDVRLREAAGSEPDGNFQAVVREYLEYFGMVEEKEGEEAREAAIGDIGEPSSAETEPEMEDPFTPSDLKVVWHMESSLRFDLLAALLEASRRHGRLDPSVPEELRNLLDKASTQPWTDDEQIALFRLKVFCDDGQGAK